MYEFHDEAWADVSPEAMDMIKKMLCVSRQKRWTAKQLLSHPWLDTSEEAVEKRKRTIPHQTITLDTLTNIPNTIALPTPSSLIIQRRNSFASSRSVSARSKGGANSQRLETADDILNRGRGEVENEKVAVVMYKSLGEWQSAFNALLISSPTVVDPAVKYA